MNKDEAEVSVEMTEDEYLEAQDSYDGVCSGCGEIREGGCEPDATDYECYDCGKFKVQGIDNALALGLIEIVEEEA